VVKQPARFRCCWSPHSRALSRCCCPSLRPPSPEPIRSDRRSMHDGRVFSTQLALANPLRVRYRSKPPVVNPPRVHRFPSLPPAFGSLENRPLLSPPSRSSSAPACSRTLVRKLPLYKQRSLVNRVATSSERMLRIWISRFVKLEFSRGLLLTAQKKISFKSRLDILMYKQEYYVISLGKVLASIWLNLYWCKYYFCSHSIKDYNIFAHIWEYLVLI